MAFYSNNKYIREIVYMDTFPLHDDHTKFTASFPLHDDHTKFTLTWTMSLCINYIIFLSLFNKSCVSAFQYHDGMRGYYSVEDHGILYRVEDHGILYHVG